MEETIKIKEFTSVKALTDKVLGVMDNIDLAKDLPEFELTMTLEEAVLFHEELSNPVKAHLFTPRKGMVEILKAQAEKPFDTAESYWLGPLGTKWKTIVG